jgi:tRNA A37 threonylcarbamoyladenosine dehydratase
MADALSDEEMLRYNRQIILRGFDFDGQERLKASRVLVVGLGGLGCAAAQYLAAAGIGQMTLLDFDTVALSIFSARRCTATRRLASRRWHPPKPPWRASTRMFNSTALTPCWMKAP